MNYFHASCDVVCKLDYASFFDAKEASALQIDVKQVNTAQLHENNEENGFHFFYTWVKQNSDQVVALSCYQPKEVDYSKIADLVGRCSHLRYLSLNSCHPSVSDQHISAFIEPLKATKIKEIDLQWANITKRSIEALAEIPSITKIDVRNCISLKKLEKEQLQLVEIICNNQIFCHSMPLGYEGY